MVENVLGTYDCDDCGTTFRITGASVTKTAHDGWLPVCPCCEHNDDVRRTDQPEDIPYASAD